MSVPNIPHLWIDRLLKAQVGTASVIRTFLIGAIEVAPSVLSSRDVFSLREACLLWPLLKSESARLDRLSKVTGMDIHTVSNVVGTLREKRLVATEKAGDVDVVLTDVGRDFCRAVPR